MLAWFFRGSGPVLIKKLYLCVWGGGGGGSPGTPVPPSGSAHVTIGTKFLIICNLLGNFHDLLSSECLQNYSNFSKNSFRYNIRVSNCLVPDQSGLTFRRS